MFRYIIYYYIGLRKGVNTMKFGHFMKDLDTKMENKGEELIISIHGKKEQLAVVEKKLLALKELCCDCCSDDSQCC